MTPKFLFNNRDLLFSVSDYLSPVDMYSLNEVFPSKYSSKYCKRNIIRGMNNSLRGVFGENLGAFKEALKACGGVVSGSFILQSILGEKWIGSDLDIFSPKNNDINRFLLTCYGVAGDDRFFARGYDHLLSEMLRIRDCYINSGAQLVQEIQIKKQAGELFPYVLEHFDLDICKSVYGIREDGTEYMNINKVDAIMNKTVTFDFKGDISKALSRCDKYRKRGFRFDIPVGMFEKVREMVKDQYDMLDVERGVDYAGYTVYKYFFCDAFAMIEDNMVQPCEENCLVRLLDPNGTHIHVLDRWRIRKSHKKLILICKKN
ncbi:MAG: hypothetical protein Harvfovirus40_12 [Harvfovirus sp.]|uniref:Uncharacterized protein n=1 Tax=Harvfovirus sp. TaxID=2487768 RepID=A0A3G5A843_9VIRU|nr:MAG: hypothetical protein Harvfovirus40_12 [Harvfovirus sp.]